MSKLRICNKEVNRRKADTVSREEAEADLFRDTDGRVIDSEHVLLSLLLPPAVKELMRRLDLEVKELCGEPHDRGGENHRWGTQPGSSYLGGHKVRFDRQRVRNKETGEEVPIETYRRFQDPSLFNSAVFAEGMKKVSQRDYKKGRSKISASLGFSKSTVSRHWMEATEEKLKELNERTFHDKDIVGVIIDGKRYRKEGVVVAMGIPLAGPKIVLGIYQCNTENSEACKALLNNLEKRGLPERELLFIVDGGSGLNKALEEKYDVHLPESRRAVRVRCFVHKWRNLEKVLNDEHKREAASLFWGIRDANDYGLALQCSKSLEDFLGKVNASALESYREAKDDLLMVHHLALNTPLKRFFSTTNSIESLNYLTEEDLRRVKRWQNSNQLQRWLAASCLENEKRMRRIMGYKGLPALKARLQRLCATAETGTDFEGKTDEENVA